MKLSRRRASLSRPSSSTGKSGSAFMSARAKSPTPVRAGGSPSVAVESYPLHATGGRGALEHVARERTALELLHAPPGELVHPTRVVGAAGHAPPPRRPGIPHP